MGNKITVQDIVNLFIRKFEIEQEHAEAFSKAFFELIIEGLEKDRYVKIKGLGTFKLVNIDSRESINVNTGERFEIQSHTKVSFTPETSLRDRINKPFAHFETVVLNENVTFDDEQENIKPTEPEETKEPEILVSPVIPKQEDKDSVEENSAQKEEVNMTSDLDREENTQEEVEEKEIEQPTERVAEEIPELAPTESTPQTEVKPSSKATTTNNDTRVRNYLIILIIVVLLLCGGIILYVCYPDLFSKKQNSSADITMPVPEKTEIIIPADTVEIKDKDTVTVDLAPTELEKNVDQVKVKRKTNTTSKPKTPVNPDSTSYKITGTKTTYKLQEGETLIRVSLRFYGTKDLWPYLLKHNRDIIKNPDVVPSGITLKIPELKKK
ncbi:HU family DNA-binding protein [Bacteroides sp. 224]|uniref:HU family DNA-binding protein n=1 Tax=Bacteroides sp. 224 TaxID=2302936 RepID=UPI0013D717A0|nr:HU family DNA-binding protein [Bacteroides sp. 224]NDV64411.1 hypothetical protein [Bacteroides sp. 224]